MAFNRGRNRNYVGIEITDTEIRGVNVRHSGNRSQVTAHAILQIEAGLVSGGFIQNPGLVGQALKKLSERLKVDNSTRVSIAVPDARVSTYRISVPAVAGTDLKTIVDGEVAHYHLVEDQGTYGFFKLRSPNSQAVDEVPVLIAATHSSTVLHLQEACESQNLYLVSLEPAQFARLRALVPFLAHEESVVILNFHETSADLTLLVKGELWFYRSLNVGANLLVSETEDGRLDLNDARIDELAVDIRRSVDYFEREFDVSALPRRMLVTSVTERMATFLEPIATRLDIELRWTDAFSTWLGDKSNNYDPDETVVRAFVPNSPVESVPQGALAYNTAYGIALMDRADLVNGAPRVEIYKRDFALEQKKDTQRNLLGSVLVSIGALAVGLGGWLFGSYQVNELQRQTEDTKTRADNIRKQAELADRTVRRLVQQADLLRKDGLPAVSVIDEISLSTPNGVGIKAIDISQEQNVTIEGNTNEESLIVDMVRRLQLGKALTTPTIAGIERKKEENTSFIEFKLSARTYNLAEVEYAGKPLPVVPEIDPTVDPKAPQPTPTGGQ
jgi:Tfp pilus assembly PilM family ATPase/Tfp pilus assembly protein PilN